MRIPPVARPLLVLAALAVIACRTSAGDTTDDPRPEARSPTTDPPRRAPSGPPRFVPAPPGEVPAVVLSEAARARAAGRRLVVYEGAPWCEPCQYFHAAVEKGQLDATFPGVTLLEFDADRDRDRLGAAGYGSQYIPLFALPGTDGRAGPKAAGGIKGDGAVPYLTKKLEQLLAQGS